MALWQEEDYGVVADRACWAMFGVTARTYWTDRKGGGHVLY
jgi:hypothetical protein